RLEALWQEGREVKLVICDWLMPGMKGDAFLSKLRERVPSCSILVITGQADRDAIETFKTEIQARILYKPWKSEELMQIITELMES
ncbi:MAG: response regulator, partial [Spirochaetales bacterium]